MRDKKGFWCFYSLFYFKSTYTQNDKDCFFLLIIYYYVQTADAFPNLRISSNQIQFKYSGFLDGFGAKTRRKAPLVETIILILGYQISNLDIVVHTTRRKYHTTLTLFMRFCSKYKLYAVQAFKYTINHTTNG